MRAAQRTGFEVATRDLTNRNWIVRSASVPRCQASHQRCLVAPYLSVHPKASLDPGRGFVSSDRPMKFLHARRPVTEVIDQLPG